MPPGCPCSGAFSHAALIACARAKPASFSLSRPTTRSTMLLTLDDGSISLSGRTRPNHSSARNRTSIRSACPVWPGQSMTAHWGVEDPAAVEGTVIEKERAFVQALRYLKNRISVFVSLPIKSLDEIALGNRLREIGRMEGATGRKPEVA